MPLYYYANGTRHALDPVTDRVAIDARAAERAGLTARLASVAVESKLPAGMTIVLKSGLDADLTTKLTAAGALQPVYRTGSTLVVLVPEVRVELDAGQADAAMAAIKGATIASEITGTSAERISLKPVSCRGEDALRLANHIYETAHPAASTVRMLSVAARPMPPRK